jgi:hypothetical protein
MSKLSLMGSLAAALVAAAPAARAQATPGARVGPVALEPRRAGAIHLGAGIGFIGGTYPHGLIEVQHHFGPRFQGHAVAGGLAGAWWPNRSGASVTGSFRYQYDLQLVSGARFYVAPYVGMELGLAIVDNKMALAGVRIVTIPTAGLELKFILDRLLLGFRPFGIRAPLFFGEPQRSGPPLQWDILWDISLSIGFTF